MHIFLDLKDILQTSNFEKSTMKLYVQIFGAIFAALYLIPVYSDSLPQIDDVYFISPNSSDNSQFGNESSAKFYGGISVDGGSILLDNQNVKQGQTIAVNGKIIPAPEHGGQEAEIVVVGLYLSDNEIAEATEVDNCDVTKGSWYMNTRYVANPQDNQYCNWISQSANGGILQPGAICNNRPTLRRSTPESYWNAWNGKLDPNNLRSLYTVQLPSDQTAVEFTVDSGKVLYQDAVTYTGQVCIHFGYRLVKDGTLVFNGKPVTYRVNSVPSSETTPSQKKVIAEYNEAVIPEGFTKMSLQDAILRDEAFSYLETAESASPEEKELTLSKINGLRDISCTEFSCIFTLPDGHESSYIYPVVETNPNVLDFLSQVSITTKTRKTRKITHGNTTDIGVEPINKKVLILESTTPTFSDEVNAGIQYQFELISNLLQEFDYTVDWYRGADATRPKFELAKSPEYDLVLISAHGSHDGSIQTATTCKYCDDENQFNIRHYRSAGTHGPEGDALYYFNIKPVWWQGANLDKKLLIFSVCEVFSEKSTLPNILLNTGASALGFESLSYAVLTDHYILHFIAKALSAQVNPKSIDIFESNYLPIFSAYSLSKTLFINFLNEDRLGLTSQKRDLLESHIVGHSYILGNRNLYLSLPSIDIPILSITGGDSQLTLSWTEVTDAEYTLYLDKSDRTEVIYTGNATNYVHTGLTNGTNYTYRIKATVNEVDSELSAPVSATPVALLTKPTLEAVAEIEQIKLSWNNVENAASYNIYRIPAFGSPVNVTTLTYNDTNLSSSQSYCYQISAVANGNESERSEQRCVTPLTAPKPPENTTPAPEEEEAYITFSEGSCKFKFGNQDYEKIYPNMATEDNPLKVQEYCLNILGVVNTSDYSGSECRWSLQTYDSQQNKYTNTLYYGGDKEFTDECSTSGFMWFSKTDGDSEIGHDNSFEPGFYELTLTHNASLEDPDVTQENSFFWIDDIDYGWRHFTWYFEVVK